MQTPGHMVINLALLGGVFGPPEAVLLGGLLPDVPIMVLYVYHHFVLRTPDEEIWSVHYQKPFWLGLVHGAHSLPLTALAALACYGAGLPAGVALFASMFAHALGDLPVHAIDAHRHFLPFSQWRFISPLSYWDLAYHARWVALAEALLVLGCAVVVAGRGAPAWGLGLLVVVNVAYAVHYVRMFVRGAGSMEVGG